MRYWELTETRWWDDARNVRLYHGTSSALVEDISNNGLRPPQENILDYALDILEEYIPKNQWTPELIERISQHAARVELGRKGDRGAVLYFFHDAKDVEGYAQSYAVHGGEIAYDVYMTACIFLADPEVTMRELKANPPLSPRYFSSSPVVVEVEVPKTWCIWGDGESLEGLVNRYQSAWFRGDQWTKRYHDIETFMHSVMKNREIRIDREIPSHMIKSISPITSTVIETINLTSPSIAELQFALSEKQILQGRIISESIHINEYTVMPSFLVSRDINILHGKELFRSELGGFYVSGDKNIFDTLQMKQLFGELRIIH